VKVENKMCLSDVSFPFILEGFMGDLIVIKQCSGKAIIMFILFTVAFTYIYFLVLI